MNERVNHFSNSEKSQEGSSDEEGLWRMQVVDSEVKEAGSVELEKNAFGSTSRKVEEGSSKRKEILANVGKSVEVSKVLGLQFAGGEEHARGFFADLEFREEIGAMKIVLWNVRGSGREERRLEVRGLLRKFKPEIIAIQETKLEVMSDRIVSKVWDNRQVD
ncbi:hypothetical protein HHK36_009028 [Tetracentron sinense]|uniref:Endonuclease/exonuclease/phosphatase domain-containing protein n=1 Tax=Tetracentron sinense TaxID=13715 RepID=A0A835DH28_TETSI|nr:hypothetical protein HHK36_009028 [Tetracentron sinense]